MEEEESGSNISASNMFNFGMGAWSIFTNEKARKNALTASANYKLANARSMREQARINLQRQQTGILQVGKELERRVDSIINTGASNGIEISSYGDLVLSEAGNLIQQTSFQLEEANDNFILQMKSASNVQAQATRERKESSKFLGIF